MFSTDDQDPSIRSLLALAQTTASLPSPADRFDIDRTDFAIRAEDIEAQRRRFRKLHEYCDEAVAALRASLERAPN